LSFNLSLFQRRKKLLQSVKRKKPKKIAKKDKKGREEIEQLSKQSAHRASNRPKTKVKG